MNKIIVIGKNGQLAQELSRIDSDKFILLGRDDINVHCADEVEHSIAQHGASALINASAYTAVDKAESEKEACFALNHTVVENLARACKSQSIPMVHVSTDYVFRGDKGSPYKVDDAYDPQGVYGASKAAGEEALMAILPDTSCIIRTSWVYSAFGNNFVKTMLKLMNTRSELTIIDDQIGSPTWSKGLAHACAEAADKPLSGIYHWSDEGVASWFDFAVAIQELGLQKGVLRQPTKIKPIPTKDYPTPAARPHYSVLDKTLTRKSFTQSPLQHWHAQLSDMLDELYSEIQ